MNKRNYNNEMKNVIGGLNGQKPRLLLHCCCGPCSTAVIEKLFDFFDLTLFYYNPNTYPQSEYFKRLEVLNDFVNDAYPDIKIISAPYNPLEYTDVVKSIEDTTEGGPRCRACIALRLSATAKYASQHNFEYFCSTLSVSPLKNAEYINTIGLSLAEKYNIKYLINDFKKENGYLRSVNLSKQYKMYRQDYCGCKTSLESKEEFYG